LMIRRMAMENLSGLMAAATRVTGFMVNSMAKVCT
jgi:hypothetical protein